MTQKTCDILLKHYTAIYTISIPNTRSIYINISDWITFNLEVTKKNTTTSIIKHCIYFTPQNLKGKIYYYIIPDNIQYLIRQYSVFKYSSKANIYPEFYK